MGVRACYGCLWKCMGVCENFCVSMGVYGSLCGLMGLYESLRESE